MTEEELKAHKEKLKLYMRAYRKKHRALALCLECTKPVFRNSLRCRKHLFAAAKINDKRRAEKAAKAEATKEQAANEALE